MATLPRNAQSALFYVEGSQTYLMINSSYGRNNTSWVHVYKRNSNTFALKKQITMPPMVEGATLCTGYVYFIYESCGRKYRDGIQYTSNDSASVANIVIGRAIGFTSTFIFK